MALGQRPLRLQLRGAERHGLMGIAGAAIKAKAFWSDLVILITAAQMKLWPMSGWPTEETCP